MSASQPFPPYLAEEIRDERVRQEQLRLSGKFAETCASPLMDPMLAFLVLAEEFGEVAQAVLNRTGQSHDGDDNLREELIQVAAVAAAWVEGIDAAAVP